MQPSVRIRARARPDIYAAAHWVQQNRAQFTSPVFLPIYMEIIIKEDRPSPAKPSKITTSLRGKHKIARQRDVVRQPNSGGVQPLQELQRHGVDCYFWIKLRVLRDYLKYSFGGGIL
ncbi:9498_t:CDS:2 [Paraglomus occultum]|uniref:9498_t:CDS:1 n=1 Tax=Paraglomus occultum TaxID=144539 RepID=A0A9N9BK97_9GLOM|nr:9498_t:CDS:2 [Paraglomus occultum]